MLSRIVLLWVTVAMLATGCGDDAAPADEGVVAAFYPLAYAAEQVGATGVVNLTPAGAEPHELELSARDVERVRDAKLVVYLGFGFQPSVEDAVERRAGPSLDVLRRMILLGRPDERRVFDLHVWLDPVRFAAIAQSIAEALGEPSAADSVVRRLTALDVEFRRGLASCRRREIVTSHAAFGYLAARYGLTEIPLVGASPEAEPSPKELERLVRKVRASGATTVFAETLVSPELAETVAREAGAVTEVLNPLEGLSRAQLEANADYFSVMRDNLAALRLALGCA